MWSGIRRTARDSAIHAYVSILPKTLLPHSGCHIRLSRVPPMLCSGPHWLSILNTEVSVPGFPNCRFSASFPLATMNSLSKSVVCICFVNKFICVIRTLLISCIYPTTYTSVARTPVTWPLVTRKGWEMPFFLNHNERPATQRRNFRGLWKQLVVMRY